MNDDLISRRAAIDAVRKWFDKIQLNGDICLDGIISLPSVTPKAEQKAVLDKIRAEIEQHCCITVGSEDEPAMTLYDIFQILDKYKAESEDKE